MVLIVAVTGTIGSGKGEAARYISHRYYCTLLDHSAIMGDVLRRLGRPVNRAEKRKLRRERGNTFTAELILKRIATQKLNAVVIGSLRLPEELNILKARYPDARLIAVTAAAAVRFRRSLQRAQYADTPATLQAFLADDTKEEKLFHFPETFRLADVVIENNGSLTELHQKIDAAMKGFKRAGQTDVTMKLIFLGPPGVGKGTYASRVGPKLGIPQISTGDLVRAEIKRGSPLGKKIQEYNDKGQLVPDEVITEMLAQRLREADAQKGFILDGFPRTLPQAEALEQLTLIDKVININLSEEILVKKIAARRVCKTCGQIYNLADIQEEGIHMPPLLPKKDGICDRCGGLLVQRDDDREDVVKGRLEIYRKQTAPLIEHYRQKGILSDFTVTGGPDEMVPALMTLIAGN